MAVLNCRFWAIALLGIITLGGTLPAYAFGGHAAAPMHIQREVGRLRAQRRIMVPRREPHSNRGRAIDNNVASAFGSDSPYFDGLPADVYSDGTETPAGPDVVLLPNPPSVTAPNPALEAPLDFSYVTGCRPIPNGYHCDSQRQ